MNTCKNKSQSVDSNEQNSDAPSSCMAEIVKQRVRAVIGTGTEMSLIRKNSCTSLMSNVHSFGRGAPKLCGVNGKKLRSAGTVSLGCKLGK